MSMHDENMRRFWESQRLRKEHEYRMEEARTIARGPTGSSLGILAEVGNYIETRRIRKLLEQEQPQKIPEIERLDNQPKLKLVTKEMIEEKAVEDRRIYEKATARRGKLLRKVLLLAVGMGSLFFFLGKVGAVAVLLLIGIIFLMFKD
jgi:hypothetical protein